MYLDCQSKAKNPDISREEPWSGTHISTLHLMTWLVQFKNLRNILSAYLEPGYLLTKQEHVTYEDITFDFTYGQN